MGDVVRLPRETARPVLRAYEDPRWADLHAPEPATSGSGNTFVQADARIAAANCRCTAGHVCRHNNACLRSGR